MFYSPTTGGFYSQAIHGDSMPTDVVAITDERHADLLAGQAAGQRIVAGQDGAPMLADPPPYVPPPVIVVTMRQARLALLAAGKLGQIDAAIDSLPSPQKEAARIEWEYSQEVQRQKPLVLALAPALGLDAAALDALFLAASKL
jgi:hypothetical protein